MAVYNLLKTKIKLKSLLLSKQITTLAFTNSYHTRVTVTSQLLKGPLVLLPCNGASSTVLFRHNRQFLSSAIPVGTPFHHSLSSSSSSSSYSLLETKSVHSRIKMTHIPDTPQSSVREFASSSSAGGNVEVSPGQGSSASGAEPPASSSSSSNANLSTKEKLKQAVKDYGSTVLVFHIAMSLTSLGIVYALVSSGLDVASVLEKLGVGQSILESKITQGASTFVVAYAIHKVFAPVRITITLGATPFIVKYLRRVGVLKIKPVKAD